MFWLENTCNYSKCDKRDTCVRYNGDGVYSLKSLCSNLTFKYYIEKETKMEEVKNDSK